MVEVLRTGPAQVIMQGRGQSQVSCKASGGGRGRQREGREGRSSRGNKCDGSGVFVLLQPQK